MLNNELIYETNEEIYTANLLTHKERWTSIFINGEKTNYKISTHGRLMNIKTKKIFDFSNNNSRYYRVELAHNGNRYTFSIHRLVATYFCKIPKRHREAGLTFEDLVPNHKDGIKHHNASFNLEWVTQKENMDHAFREKLCTGIFGEKSHLSTITNEDAMNICELIQAGKNNEVISKELNINTKIIQHIRSGECWKSISKNYNFPKLGEAVPYTMPDEKVHEICRLLEEGLLKSIEIARKVGVKREYVKDIKTYRRRRDISKNYNF